MAATLASGAALVVNVQSAAGFPVRASSSARKETGFS